MLFRPVPLPGQRRAESREVPLGEHGNSPSVTFQAVASFISDAETSLLCSCQGAKEKASGLCAPDAGGSTPVVRISTRGTSPGPTSRTARSTNSAHAHGRATWACSLRNSFWLLACVCRSSCPPRLYYNPGGSSCQRRLAVQDLARWGETLRSHVADLAQRIELGRTHPAHIGASGTHLARIWCRYPTRCGRTWHAAERNGTHRGRPPDRMRAHLVRNGTHLARAERSWEAPGTHRVWAARNGTQLMQAERTAAKRTKPENVAGVQDNFKVGTQSRANKEPEPGGFMGNQRTGTRQLSSRVSLVKHTS